MVSQYLCNYQAIQWFLILIKNFKIVFANANHVDFPFRESIKIDFILFDPSTMMNIQECQTRCIIKTIKWHVASRIVLSRDSVGKKTTIL